VSDDWSSLRINVSRLRHRDTLAELKRRPHGDSSTPIRASVVASGLSVTTSRIPEGSIVEIDGAVEPSLTGIDVRLHVRSSWEGECRRCLDMVTEPIELNLIVPFLPEHEADDHADAYPIDGDWIDVGEVVREELMLALPLSPLCKDDCSGVDPDRFPNIGDEEEPPEVESSGIDPRWAALSELTFDEE
jgi:uncharacterized protein